MKPIHLALRHATLIVRHDLREVDTVFRDGAVQGAQRQFSAEDRQTARDLGYAGNDAGVMRSLVCHELAHTLVSEWLWDRPSEVLRHYCSAEYCPYWQRLYVESIVLGMERYLNTGEVGDALRPFWFRLEAWRKEAAGWLEIAMHAQERAA